MRRLPCRHSIPFAVRAANLEVSAAVGEYIEVGITLVMMGARELHVLILRAVKAEIISTIDYYSNVFSLFAMSVVARSMVVFKISSAILIIR